MDITTKILIWAFCISLVFGAVANKTQFCPLGGINMLVNKGDPSRLYSWLFAGTVALIGMLLLEFSGILSLDKSIPPYRMANFMWPRYILGGILFGVGMTLCAGCGMRNLIRLGSGNLKSIFVILAMGAMGFVMARTNFFYYGFAQWMEPVAIDLTEHGINFQDLGSIYMGMKDLPDNTAPRLVIGSIIAVVMLFVMFRNRAFRANRDYLTSGLVLGTLIVVAYYITGGPLGVEWKEAVEFMDQPPAMVGLQSYTFIAPMGDYLYWLREPSSTQLVTFGIVAISGVWTGAFIYSLISRQMQWQWFSSWAEFSKYVIGAGMVGMGGVLGMGCTLGQGIAGFSTLAVGSYLALVSIIFGAGWSIRAQQHISDGAPVFNAIKTGAQDLLTIRQRRE